MTSEQAGAERRRRFPARWSHQPADVQVGGGSSAPPAVVDVPVSVRDVLGEDKAAMRWRMVRWLCAQGVRDERVLRALAAVPRHRFVNSALWDQAYEDTSLPIGYGQTISKPSVVARMLEWLLLGRNAQALGHLGRVLEIGSGCGYQTRVLSLLAPTVVSAERLQPLHHLAVEHLRRWRVPGAGDCMLVFQDGSAGVAPHAPFDSIVAAASAERIPSAWLEQLRIGGRLVAPVQAPNGVGQVLQIVDRTPQGWHTLQGEGVQFVPLKSGTA
jgi:protein-L-isoaspartate(D-aspartate) O-methyltransferase